MKIFDSTDDAKNQGVSYLKASVIWACDFWIIKELLTQHDWLYHDSHW